MNVIYDTKISDLFNSDVKLKKVLNIDLAKIIRRREAELSSFDDFLSFLNHGLGKPHSLESSKGTNERGYYGVSLTANYRLIIKPNCENTNAETLKECKEVIIMGVKDYHGKNEKWLVP